MTTRLLRMLATIKAVRRDIQPWVHHLTGEGPATIRRQREAIAQGLATPPLSLAAHRTLAHERSAHPEARAVAGIAGRPVLTTH
jgi:hypothetical protein